MHELYICRELKLRNYTPEDEELKERQVPKAKPASGKNTLYRHKIHFLSVNILALFEFQVESIQ